MTKIRSKLPNVGTTIFTEMSSLAREHKAINLSQGFPNYEPAEALRERVSFHMNNGKNQYPHMYGVPELRETISRKIKRCYDIEVDFDQEINVTAGGTQGIFTTIATFVHSGDEVIVLEPAFDCYLPAIEMLGGHQISYEMKGPDFKVDWDAVVDLVSSRTSMIIINTPHNPTGSVLTKEDFEELARITRDRDILVLSDEVYEHLTYDGFRHYSIIEHEELRKRSIAVFSLGKTLHCTGWKVGYAIMPPALMLEFRKVHQFNVFTVNSFVQHGLADYLEDPSTYEDLPAFYQQKRDQLYTSLSASSFNPIKCKGSYFILADYSKISNLPDTEFAKWMTTEHQLACIPISVFYQSGKQEQLVRFCFAKTEDILHDAGKILSRI